LPASGKQAVSSNDFDFQMRALAVSITVTPGAAQRKTEPPFFQVMQSDRLSGAVD
jgi:hypothetical protein